MLKGDQLVAWSGANTFSLPGVQLPHCSTTMPQLCTLRQIMGADSSAFQWVYFILLSFFFKLIFSLNTCGITQHQRNSRTIAVFHFSQEANSSQYLVSEMGARYFCIVCYLILSFRRK